MLLKADKGDWIVYGWDVRYFGTVAASQQHLTTSQLHDFVFSILQPLECGARFSQP